jgi:putative flippase GtrA
MQRLVRFGAVGASGALVNLGALHLLAGVLGVRELLASAIAIEASVLWNFALNDRFTFGDLRAGPWAARALRYHLVSAVGVALQLGTFGAALLAATHAGRQGLGPVRYPAQAAGIALAFAWNFAASRRWAWGRPVSGPRARRWTRRSVVPAAIFAALLVLHILPIWLVHWFPTQDGPLHVENVVALLRRGASPVLQAHYVANWGAQPNWLTQGLLAPLLAVVSPQTAEKLVLTGYTLLLPVALRTALPPGPRGWWASLAVFPFVHSFPFHMGFWNFCWGLALAFLAVGWWQRIRGRLGPARFLGLAALGACLYLAHPASLAGALLMVGALGVGRAAIALSRTRGLPARRRLVLRGYLRRGAGFAAAMLPGTVLLAAWSFAHRTHVAARIPLRELAAKLVAGYALVSIDRREVFLAAGVMLVLGALVARLLFLRLRRDRGRPGRRTLGRARPADGWLAAAGAFAVLYFVIPDVADAGAHISDRNALFAFLCLVAWIAAQRESPRLVRVASLALAALAVLALGVRFEKQRVLSSYLDEYVSASRVVGPDPVLLPLPLAPHGPRDEHGRRLGYRIKPFLHAAGWIVAEQGGVDLENSQAQTDQCPVRFRPDRNPFRTIATSIQRMEGVPPCVDLRLASRVGPLDYVLVWGATRENLGTPCGAALAASLAAWYEPVFLSEPRGLLEVFRPRPVTAER